MAYHLQFIGASIGFYRTSLTLLVQDLLKTDKKEFFDIFVKTNFLTGFYQKSTIIDLPYFLASAMWTRVKNYTFWRKSPISPKKFVKNHDFLEKFDFCDFNFSALLEVYTCARATSIYSYRGKSPRKFILWQFFRKYQPGMFFVRHTPDIRNFSMLKKQKFLNCDFWPRKCSKWPNLVPGAITNMFWVQTIILKFFDFWT